MPYQGDYLPEYDNYGNYNGRGFPGNGQPQQQRMYGQPAGAGTGSWSPQQSAFPYAEQQQAPLYRSPQYPQYQQQFQQYNPYQQLPPTQSGHQAPSRQAPLTAGAYQQSYQQRHQPASRYQPQFPTIPSSPDPLQPYQPPPQRFQLTNSRTQHQTPQRSQMQSHAPNFEPQRATPSSQPAQEQARIPQQIKHPTVYIPGNSQPNQPASLKQRNDLSVKSSGPRQGHSTPRYNPQTTSEQPRGQGQSSSTQHRPHQTIPQQQPTQIKEDPSGHGTIQPSLLQRKVTHVEIPAVPILKTEKPEMARTPKRRKSNEGDTIEVKHRTKPDLPSPAQPPPSSSLLSELPSSQIPPTPTALPNIDNQAALLALSDEYINAAYTMSASVTSMEISDKVLHRYHDLLASGIGCLEAILKNYRILDARREAQIRLRFASLLCEETENNDTAEEVLVKGISLCERARLTDLKYAMHHVLARVCFEGDKSKAALRNLDKLINEVEKLNLVHWIYAFRFLRVSLGLQTGNSHAESTILSRQLVAISNLASANSQVAVQIVAHAFDALLHLRSQTPESVDLAQRAIAAARTHQLSPDMESLPQIKILLDCLDLSCGLIRVNPDQAATKLQTMHSNLDGQAKSPGWTKDGSWLLPLGSSATTSPNIEADTCGIMKTTKDGRPALTFQWLPRSRVYMLGFLLSGLASLHKSTNNDRKADLFFKEGLMLTNGPPKETMRSMTAVGEEVNAQQLMRIVLLLYVAFGYCVRSDWSKASKAVISIRKELDKIETVPDTIIPPLMTYLEAVSKHGQGDLTGALELYRSQALALPEENTKFTDPLRVLSSLNCILILRRADKAGFNSENTDHIESDRLLTRLEPYCTTQQTNNGVEYGNKPLEAAFNILKATNTTQTVGQGTIIRTKQYLTAAVHAAKGVVDNRLMCVVMNIMTQFFFTSMVGEQAEKSARTSRNLAEKTQDHLWTAVANKMFGDTMERSGKVDEAEPAWQMAQKSAHALPEKLKAALGLENNV